MTYVNLPFGWNARWRGPLPGGVRSRQDVLCERHSADSWNRCQHLQLVQCQRFATLRQIRSSNSDDLQNLLVADPTARVAVDDLNYAPVNIGQVKALFGFDPFYFYQ